MLNITFSLKRNSSKVVLLLFLILSINTTAQTFTDSNLPIVVIDTDIDPNTNLPIVIPDDPRVLGNMKIIKRPDGTRNYLTDSNTPAYLNYNGRINIEIRGSTSQSLPKKPYGLTTLKADNVSNNNVSLLGMPSENDWILNSLAFDPSMIRDYLSYNLSRQIGDYASRTAYCEVVINGEYMGLYVFQEKIKSNANRVNILKIANADTTFPNVTGGYITKADKTTGGDPIAWNMSSYAGATDFIHELPKPAAVTTEQNTYIYNQFLNLESTSHTNNTDLITGYSSVIDVPSFVDFMLLNELASNVDAYQYSTYFHKDRDGKLRAGPIWDFNLTYGNDLFQWGFDRSKTNIWQFSNGDNEGAKFWTDLYNNPLFKCYLSRRFSELIQTGQPLNYASMVSFIDQTVSYFNEAKLRDNQKWGLLRNDTTEISDLKSFLSTRISWITTQLGANSMCNSISLPALVINKINYNPTPSAGFSVSNDLEFIEIKNAGTTDVNLTGFYLKELGLSYQFPANSSVSANQSVYLASNSATFLAKYGVAAFGQFTRNLANSSQKIVLADGFGNTIDTVEYFDVSPWDSAADGNGSYLQLISTSLDNNVASSWVASTNENLSTATFLNDSKLTFYPNPVTNALTIHSEKAINGVKIFDVTGALLFEVNQKSETIHTNWSAYPKGVYFVTVYDDQGIITKKIIK